MASVNKVILVGNLGRDPEVRSFPNGGQIANVTIATTERWRDKNTGENREITEWHNVVFNDRLAEIAGQYLRKGSSVYVEGSLRTRKWTDQNGQDRYTTEVRANVMQMLGGRAQGGSTASYGDAGGDYGDAAGYEPPPAARRATAPAPRTTAAPAARSTAAPRPAAAPAPAPAPVAATGFDDMDDDIPF